MLALKPTYISSCMHNLICINLYLWLSPDRHNFSDVVYKSCKLEPIFVWMHLAYTLCRLKRMDCVWYVNLRNAFYNHIITYHSSVR